MKKAKDNLIPFPHRGGYTAAPENTTSGNQAHSLVITKPSPSSVSRDTESSIDTTFNDGRVGGQDDDRDLGAVVRLDEFTDGMLEKYAENLQLIRLKERGLSASDALKRTGAKRTPREVNYLYARYQKYGKQAAVDRRMLRKPPSHVLIPFIKELLFKLYFAAPAAGARGVWRMLKKELSRINADVEAGRTAPVAELLKLPSVSSVHAYLSKLPNAVKKARTSRGYNEYQKQGAPYTRYENTTNANERWQMDHTTLKIWIRVRQNGKWKAVRCYLTIALDAHSRAIMGFWLSTKYPDTWAIKIMLYFAIRPKQVSALNVFGLPRIIQCDNGADYISIAMRVCVGALDITMDVDPPRYPNSKGKCERFFKTLDTICIRLQPGHIIDIGTSETSADKRIGELLTRDQLKKEIQAAIAEYHNTIHGTTERKPLELWKETVLGPVLPEEDELNTLLLQHDKTRTIQGLGINIKLKDTKHLYWHPAFVHHWKEKVSLAYNPEDMDSALIYGSDGKFICEAWDLRAENPRYGLTDVRGARKKHLALLRGIRQRGRDYMEEIWRDDRRVEQEKAHEAVQEIVEEMKTTAELETGNTDELSSILSMFEEQDRS